MEWWLSCDASLLRFQSADYKSMLLYLVNNTSFSLVAISIDVITTHAHSFYRSTLNVSPLWRIQTIQTLHFPLMNHHTFFLLWLTLQNLYCNNNTSINDDVGGGTIAIGCRRWNCNTHDANHVGTDCPCKTCYYKTQKE